MAFLKNWVTNIVMTMVFITIIEIMMPGGNMRKYVGLVVGLMVMFVIINPFVTLLAGDFNLDESVLRVSESIRLRDVSSQIDKLEGSNRENIIKLYRGNVEEQIKRDLRDQGLTDDMDVEVTIDEQWDKDYFGRIVGIRIAIQKRQQRDHQDIERIKEIEKIRVRLGETDEMAPETGMMGTEVRKEYGGILESLARTYGISQGNITITITE